MDSAERTIWIADAHRDDGKRFVVRADEKLTAFIELESAIKGRETKITSLHAVGLLFDTWTGYAGESSPIHRRA